MSSYTDEHLCVIDGYNEVTKYVTLMLIHDVKVMHITFFVEPKSETKQSQTFRPIYARLQAH